MQTESRKYPLLCQLLGSTKTYKCHKDILGYIVVCKESDAFYEKKDADKNLLLARKMNSKTMCLISLPLTDKGRQMFLYNGAPQTFNLDMQLKLETIYSPYFTPTM
jgi:hypothetical protein